MDLTSGVPTTPHGDGSAVEHLRNRESHPKSVRLQEGAMIADRYRVERELGEGGMGAVYLVEHTRMRKRFALKLLHPEIATDELVARFSREAITAANIGHPNIAGAIDCGPLGDGSFFLVLEYVSGRSVRQLMIDEGALEPARALGLARQVLLALGAAHDKGIVHRDIKPENLMLMERADGQDAVKVLDFGLAKVKVESNNEEALTKAGAIYGTPLYMAPEQALGREVDARVDLYAVGVLLFEMLTGEPLFDGEGLAVIIQHVHTPPPKLTCPRQPAACTVELANLVSGLLEKDPDRRTQDVKTAIGQLDLAQVSIDPPAERLPAQPPPFTWPVVKQEIRRTVVELVGLARSGSLRLVPHLKRLKVQAKRIFSLVARRLKLTEKQLAIILIACAVGVVILGWILGSMSSLPEKDQAELRVRVLTRHIISD